MLDIKVCMEQTLSQLNVEPLQKIAHERSQMTATGTRAKMLVCLSLNLFVLEMGLPVAQDDLMLMVMVKNDFELLILLEIKPRAFNMLGKALDQVSHIPSLLQRHSSKS